MFALMEDDKLLVGDSIQHDINHVSYETACFYLVDREWHVVGRHKWFREDTMPAYEARSTLHAVRHYFRKVTNFGHRFNVLTDSMTAAVAFDKGRASGHKLRRVVQQVAAYTLVRGSGLRCRLVPSEWNPADNVSHSALWG